MLFISRIPSRFPAVHVDVHTLEQAYWDHAHICFCAVATLARSNIHAERCIHVVLWLCAVNMQNLWRLGEFLMSRLWFGAFVCVCVWVCE